MDRSSVVYLISESHEQDENGVFTATERRRKVFAGVISVGQNEWHQGARNGLNPSLRITVFGPDYHDEEVLEYNRKRYTVYRTFQGKSDTIDLYVEYRKGDSK